MTKELSQHPKAIRAREWRAKNPERAAIIDRRKNLKHKYGITLEEFDRLIKEQEHCCKICGIHDSDTPWPHKLVVDHCHDTNEVRGLLCSSCNRALGLLKDSTEVVQSALDYLIKSKIKNNE